jgi:hypothetical protein
MAITIAQVPTYPAPGRKVRVTPTAGAGGNFARLWLTDAPLGSEWRRKLAESTASRVELAATDSGKAFEFTPDVGGVYVCTAQEYTLGATAHGGAYEGDPDGYQTETKVGAESTVSIYAGERLEQTIGVGADTVRLAVWVWNDTIRQTTLAEHGEATPAVSRPSSDKARIASLSSDVIGALSGLVDQSASIALGTLSTVISDIKTKLLAHEASLTVHTAADEDNEPDERVDLASGPEGVAASAQHLAMLFSRHVRNDDAGSGTMSAASPYHVLSAVPKVDWTNVPAFGSCATVEQALSVIASVWEAYEAHRVSTAVHLAADSTNTLTSLPLLLRVHKAFSAVVRSLAPSAPGVVSGAAVLLVHGAGFRSSADTERTGDTSAAPPLISTVLDY